jgi:hypothetical protein
MYSHAICLSSQVKFYWSLWSSPGWWFTVHLGNITIYLFEFNFCESLYIFFWYFFWMLIPVCWASKFCTWGSESRIGYVHLSLKLRFKLFIWINKEKISSNFVSYLVARCGSSLPYICRWFLKKKNPKSQALVAYAYNPSFSGGLCFEASQGKWLMRPYLKKTHHKKGLLEWLKV